MVTVKNDKEIAKELEISLDQLATIRSFVKRSYEQDQYGGTMNQRISGNYPYVERKGTMIALVEPVKSTTHSFSKSKRSTLPVTKIVKSSEFESWEEDKNLLSLSILNGCYEDQFSAKRFFEKYNPKLIKWEDPNIDIDVDPSQKIIDKLKSIGQFNTEFYQGGFPSSTKIEFSIYDDKCRNRFKTILKQTKTREQLIQIGKAIYGMRFHNELKNLFFKRAEELKLTNKEINSIKEFRTSIETVTNYNW